MNRLTQITAAVILLASGAFLGQLFGSRASAPATEAATAAVPVTAAKPLYYRHPMGLPDTSPVPKKDSMGMDYIAVYAEDAAADDVEAGKLVNLSPSKLQKLGVRTATVERRPVQREIRAVGTIVADERTLSTVAARFEGWIETLHANQTGQVIRRGDTLFTLYSPALVAAQQEYLLALEAQQSIADSLGDNLLASARQRLRNWQIADSDIAELEKQRTPLRTLPFRAPADGVVLEKMATEGMRFMPGETLYRLADLRRLWLLASVHERDLSALQLNQPVTLSVDAYPGDTFRGRVDFLYPTVDVATRTLSVRIALDNADLRLRPGMYGEVNTQPASGLEPVISIPDSALIDSGNRQIVLVQVAEGVFEPRDVVVGRRDDGHLEIRQGLSEGEQVVVRANFLIDAESNLKAALAGFGNVGGDEAGASETAAPDPSQPAVQDHQEH